MQKSYIFNSELEFRNYIILNIEDVDKIWIFEDDLDHMIFFYCFLLDGSFIATKELSTNNFDSYKKVYKKLMKLLKLHIIQEHNHSKILKLKKL